MKTETELVIVDLQKEEDWGNRILYLVAVGLDPKIVNGKIVYEREKIELTEVKDFGPT